MKFECISEKYIQILSSCISPLRNVLESEVVFVPIISTSVKGACPVGAPVSVSLPCHCSTCVNCHAEGHGICYSRPLT